MNRKIKIEWRKRAQYFPMAHWTIRYTHIQSTKYFVKVWHLVKDKMNISHKQYWIRTDLLCTLSSSGIFSQWWRGKIFENRLITEMFANRRKMINDYQYQSLIEWWTFCDSRYRDEADQKHAEISLHLLSSLRTVRCRILGKIVTALLSDCHHDQMVKQITHLLSSLPI